MSRGPRELPNAPAAVSTEVEVPTRRGLTTTVTRALVNIAGGMTGRNNTATNANPAPATAAPQARPGMTASDLMIQAASAQVRQAQQAQQQTFQAARALQGPPVAGVAGRGAGTRVVRPVSFVFISLWDWMLIGVGL